MAQVSVAGTAEVSASPDETGRQQASDKTMAQRVEEALRRRASEHRTADDMPSGTPLWFWSMPMDRSPPLRLDAMSGDSPSSGEGVSSAQQARATSADIRDATDPSTRHDGARKALVELLRANRLVGEGPPRSVTDKRTGASLAAGTSQVDASASVQRRNARSPMTDGVGGIGGVGESTTTAVDGHAATASGAASEVGQESRPEVRPHHDSRERSHRGEGGVGAPGTSTPQVTQGYALALHPGVRRFVAQGPHKPMAPRAPVHPSPSDVARRSITGGDGMRYAFGSWGKGHFVNVQVVQLDGRRGFVLGASDAMVHRRLSAALPGAASSSEEGSSRSVDVRAIEAVEKLDSTNDEDAGC
ncbi:SpaN/EivJ family type III secretion system needle length determinant [Pandoraea sputorum]|uniref:Surface presentation of antigen domain-containing protein n=1 Tax=Pandoraea sputorum TaxID=93222 RepID=A0A239S8P8_9BURK|nr:hypothetical protein [Pandoraea sputorum]AJC15591.1 hypothetical protein NA29_05155 [Pandoraea sputorum]SNU80983.1 Uncharacterised protein [Pandoraea sputorum]VVD72451.1 hypothetical protein PSP20601_00672 [Pandoraea sputorum]